MHTCVADATTVYTHNTFMYAVYFGAMYTKEIYVLCKHDTLHQAVTLVLGRTMKYKLEEQRREGLHGEENNAIILVPQAWSLSMKSRSPSANSVLLSSLKLTLFLETLFGSREPKTEYKKNWLIKLVKAIVILAK